MCINSAKLQDLEQAIHLGGFFWPYSCAKRLSNSLKQFGHFALIIKVITALQNRMGVHLLCLLMLTKMKEKRLTC
jgi:hypothetical protein